MTDTKTCTGPCGRTLPATDAHFYRRSGSTGFRSRCRDCWNLNRMESSYGLDRAAVTDMLDRQGGVCRICGSDEPGGSGAFPVDHDHESGIVRGRLCTTCNLILGLANDDPAILLSAVEYLSQASDLALQITPSA